jgi:hypothetical protein
VPHFTGLLPVGGPVKVSDTNASAADALSSQVAEPMRPVDVFNEDERSAIRREVLQVLETQDLLLSSQDRALANSLVRAAEREIAKESKK